MLIRWFWETCLVSVLIHGSDTKQTSSTLHSGHCNRMSYTAIREPAIVTFVQAHPPSCVELTRGSQNRIPLFALFAGFIQGHLITHRGIEHVT